MGRPRITDKKMFRGIKLRPSLNTKIKEYAKTYSISEIDIITNGIIEYMNKLEMETANDIK